MTALPPSQYPVRHVSGDSDRWAAFSVLNTSGGDTIDVSAYFSVVKRATLLGITVAAALSATVSGTVITIPAGATNDAAILTVYGCAV
jgi:hypothetical protein